MYADVGSDHRHIALHEVGGRLICLYTWCMLTWVPLEYQMYLDKWQGHLNPLESLGQMPVTQLWHLISISNATCLSLF